MVDMFGNFMQDEFIYFDLFDTYFGPAQLCWRKKLFYHGHFPDTLYSAIIIFMAVVERQL